VGSGLLAIEDDDDAEALATLPSGLRSRQLDSSPATHPLTNAASWKRPRPESVSRMAAILPSRAWIATHGGRQDRGAA